MKGLYLALAVEKIRCRHERFLLCFSAPVERSKINASPRAVNRITHPRNGTVVSTHAVDSLPGESFPKGSEDDTLSVIRSARGCGKSSSSLLFQHHRLNVVRHRQHAGYACTPVSCLAACRMTSRGSTSQTAQCVRPSGCMHTGA